MDKNEVVNETQSFVDHLKKCIAESNEIDPRYKDAVIQSLQNSADAIFSRPVDELEKGIQEIQSLEMSNEDMDDLMAEMLAAAINNQIVALQKYEGDRHE